MKKMLLMALFALQACSEAGLVPATGAAVAIPRVKVSCTSTQCRTNASAPLINVVITTSSCNDPLFGAVVSTSTQSIACTSVIGCSGEVSNWVSSSGSASTIASGSYQICGCIHFSGAGTPWVNCNSLGTLNNVNIDITGGLKTITSWNN